MPIPVATGRRKPSPNSALSENQPFETGSRGASAPSVPSRNWCPSPQSPNISAPCQRGREGTGIRPPNSTKLRTPPGAQLPREQPKVTSAPPHVSRPTATVKPSAARALKESTPAKVRPAARIPRSNTSSSNGMRAEPWPGIPVFSVPRNSGACNSNRSSVISSCSSNPTTSSSGGSNSSNRNSSSSISSTFSISSWNSIGGICTDNQDKGYSSGGGSKTFPRSSNANRNSAFYSKDQSSDDCDTEDSSTPTPQPLQSSCDQTSLPSKLNSSRMTPPSSFSSLPVPSRAVPSFCGEPPRTPQPKRNKEREQKHGSAASATVGKANQIPRLHRKVGLGSMQNSAPAKGGLLKSGNKSMSLERGKKASRMVPSEEDGGASVQNGTIMSLSASQIEGSAQASFVDCISDKVNLVQAVSTDEDDGYSSVANTDQHDDDEKLPLPPKYGRKNSDDEIYKDVMSIEPMKPLEGMARYSYLQTFGSPPMASNIQRRPASQNDIQPPRTDRHSSLSLDEHCSGRGIHSSSVGKQNDLTMMARPAVVTNSSTEPKKSAAHENKKSLDSQRSSEQLTSLDGVRRRRGVNSGQERTIPGPKVKMSSENVNCQGMDGPLTTKVPQKSNAGPAKKEPLPDVKCLGAGVQEDTSCPSSVGNESFLGLSYQNFVKPNTSRKTSNWGSNVVYLPARSAANSSDHDIRTPPRTSLPSVSRPSPSLPSLSSFQSPSSSSSTIVKQLPTRPTSLTQEHLPRGGGGVYARSEDISGLASGFCRSNSLRSTPATTPTVGEKSVSYDGSSPMSVPGTRGSSLSLPAEGLYSTPNKHSPKSCRHLFPEPPPSVSVLSSSPFIRGAVHYSTVIPRTTLEEPDENNSTESCTAAPTAKAKDDSEALCSIQNKLIAAQEKVFSLSEQLNSSTRVIASYEHTFHSMAQRLQQLIQICECKDTEIDDLHRLIEKGAAGASVAVGGAKGHSLPRGVQLIRGTSLESLNSLVSNTSRSSFISASSLRSGTSVSSQQGDKIKKKGWLRSSLSKAFRRREKRKRSLADRNSNHAFLQQITSGADAYKGGFCSLPATPLPQRVCRPDIEGILRVNSEHGSNEKLENLSKEVKKLRLRLEERESLLTDSRLEALTSAHQIDYLKDVVNKLNSHLASLQVEKEHLRNLVMSNGGISQRIHGVPVPAKDYFSVGDSGSEVDNDPLYGALSAASVVKDKDTRKVFVTVRGSCLTEGPYGGNSLIGVVSVCGKTPWSALDSMVEEVFNDYIKSVDPEGQLGLAAASIANYQLGEISRIPCLQQPDKKSSASEVMNPEFLPYGYIIGDVNSLSVNVRGIESSCLDALALEMLMPKSVLQRYLGFLKDSRRVILAGPKFSGKSYLAHRLAEYLVSRLGIEPSTGNIATFNVMEENDQDLHGFLSQLSTLCESHSTDIPLVIIIEALEKVALLQEVLSSSLRVPHDQCPFIIGTLSQLHSQDLQLLQVPQGFRWISLNIHQEPINNWLSRLCRKCVKMGTCREEANTVQGCTSTCAMELQGFLHWLPRCWHVLNQVLATSPTAGVIGPLAFFSFPSSMHEAQQWFNKLWKSTLLPALQVAAHSAGNLSGNLERWQALHVCLRDELPWSLKGQNSICLPELPDYCQPE